ncbi:hypothetical protein SMSP2_02961 [Limihaloglobus sulfuriphilus]|uniref:Uncharacterized protein n=1 Tax=Limihaloglobus sulfuriphilus TaxID=1851148 RepID=A0A1Q2MIQ4_9BACT|nr:hypothetical protein SMSP2_02961 [Limihaloglobus sulfuriphilus]
MVAKQRVSTLLIIPPTFNYPQAKIVPNRIGVNHF